MVDECPVCKCMTEISIMPNILMIDQDNLRKLNNDFVKSDDPKDHQVWSFRLTLKHCQECGNIFA